MLGNTHTRASYGQSGGSGDVESSTCIATSTTSIDQSVTFSSADIQGEVMNLQRSCSLSDRLGEANDLFDRLPLHVQSDEQRSNLCVSGTAAEDLRHYIARHFAGERLAMIRHLMQGFDDHAVLPN